MTAYENLVNEYNNKIQEVVNNTSLTSAEKFIQQVSLKSEYETPIAKAFLATLFA